MAQLERSAVSLSHDEFAAVAAEGKYNLIPLHLDINADLDTPVSAFVKARSGSNCFLLESVEGAENVARYSFIGTDPYMVLQQDGKDPLPALEAELHRYKVRPDPTLPSFSGGAAGYIGYDCVQYWEPTVHISKADTLGLPDSIFLLCSNVIIFDHVKHIMKVVTHARLEGVSKDAAAIRTCYEQSVTSLLAFAQRMRQPAPWLSPLPLLRGSNDPSKPLTINLQPQITQQQYESNVIKLKEHIVKGDVFQAVPSQRQSCVLKKASAFDIYRQLRIINPSPYLFYFEFEQFQVVGASPEQLVKVENGNVSTHPIAGTAKRGKTPEEDAKLEAELLANEKERAEHIMLVDLGRNDIGRIAEPGTVKVDSLMKVERYSHVMHIVSTVSGRLAKDKTSFDALRAVFPAGTLSGAPKIRAMQLVAGLEGQKRGIYGGAVGFIGFSGVMNTCIAIRTMVVKKQTVYLQAGAGVVYDSDPTSEHKECHAKMSALARAIDQAESVACADIGPPESKVTIRDTVMKTYPPNITEIPSTFGKYGGRYVPETLVGALEDLEKEYIKVINDPAFREELRLLQRDYVGRPTPLYFAKRMTEHCGGAQIWLKREDLAHTGAHKINNALGQALVAKRMGKKRIIAETGAGQHGVATATACALLGLQAVVYMGEEDVKRQALNVFRMKMLGATVVPVLSGTKTLKDAVNEAMRDWVTNVRDTYFLIGSAIGPHPFPTIVRDFQCCIGDEIRSQFMQRIGKLPDVAIACVGGGSNAIGLFHPFIEDVGTKLIGVEAAGCGVASGKHAATIVGGTPGVLHGTRTFLLQDKNGQIAGTHSISAGLDYPGVGPEHAYLHESGRVQYVAVTDNEALEGLQSLTRLEGIIPALEPSHAIYYAMQIAPKLSKDTHLLINMCGRGDKDMYQVAEALNVKLM